MNEKYEQSLSSALQQDATGHDLSRLVATDDDYISIRDALEIFISRGRSITERTLQRYCEKQYLHGQKRITAEGEKWFVRKSSVHTRIAELEEFDRLRTSRQVATSSDVSGTVAEENKEDSGHDNQRQQTAHDRPEPVATAQQSHPAGDDQSRQVATSRDMSDAGETGKQRSELLSAERELYERIIEHLKEANSDLVKDKEALRIDKDALMQQLAAKDRQIDRFFASERDTKTLLGSLQSLVNAIWPKASKELGERYVPARDALDSGLAQNSDEPRDR